ncbi:MAG: hypothetical protein HEP71_33435 [Roseivirga sp.]|nr:hypothetical protein [Roseivirga sp.]
MKRIIGLIIGIAIVYFAYQWFVTEGSDTESSEIRGEVKGSVMILGRSFYEVVEKGTEEKYYIYSEDCCPEKGSEYIFYVESSELARLNDKSINLYTEVKREEQN